MDQGVKTNLKNQTCAVTADFPLQSVQSDQYFQVNFLSSSFAVGLLCS